MNIEGSLNTGYGRLGVRLNGPGWFPACHSPMSSERSTEPVTDSRQSATLQRHLEHLFGADPQEAARVFARLPDSLPGDWRALAAQLATALTAESRERPVVLGLSGGQGAGKSTLAHALVMALQACGLRAATLSLDDVYLTAAERIHLAAQVHPLLRTRGVPGTHDLGLLQRIFDSLDQTTLRLPVFSKAIDDRLPEGDWPSIRGPVEVLVFEGWCVGAGPQPEADVRTPVNALERTEDADGVYRHYVNQMLAEPYQAIWRQMHAWLFLAVPDLAAVVRWRTQQEHQIEPGRRMDKAALERFIAHYERLTLWLLRTAPTQANWTVQLDENHRIRL